MRIWNKRCRLRIDLFRQNIDTRVLATWIGVCGILGVALNSFREIELSLGAFELESCPIICQGRILGSLESAKPNTGCFLGVAYFRCPFSPWPLSYSSIVFFSNTLLIWSLLRRVPMLLLHRRCRVVGRARRVVAGRDDPAQSRDHCRDVGLGEGGLVGGEIVLPLFFLR